MTNFKIQIYFFSTVLTLLGFIFSCVHLFFKPNKLNFVCSLIISSLSFFMFSFQVHEKSILLPTIPFIALSPLFPLEATWFSIISTFSIYPLVKKDNLYIAYFALLLIYFSLCNLKFSFTNLKSLLFWVKKKKKKNFYIFFNTFFFYIFFFDYYSFFLFDRLLCLGSW